MEDSTFYCKDYLASGEMYRLERWKHYDILKTEPVPENLSAYYKSESYISHTDASKSFTEKLYNIDLGEKTKDALRSILENKLKNYIIL